MRPLCFGAVLAACAFATSTCKGDPTASLRTGPAFLTVMPSTILVDAGASVPLVVVARDAQFNPIAVDVAATSANSAVATVAPDAERVFPDGATHAFVVEVVGASGDSTYLRFTGGGLRDSTLVAIN
jgi:hypothetical protein